MTWREKIIAAEVHGTFHERDKLAAKEWATCAVGEHRKSYPELIVYVNSTVSSEIKIPLDTELFDLGCRFSQAVVANDIESAGRLYNKIEDRVLELKRRQ